MLQNIDMTLAGLIAGVLVFSVISIKVAARLLNVDIPGLIKSLFAVTVSLGLSVAAAYFIGDMVMASFVAIAISSAIFTVVFSVNTIVGFTLAVTNVIVQLGFIVIGATLGFVLSAAI
ncbi:hypothetical protein GCM10007086_34630 [Photobacterium aphoticum]|nr:hypothetical protein JCM19237_6619 [Photobacterium aphoticum]GHA57809.1 hypothetical protein GCM10007086_34630 [Photobacterium aphoticum]